MAAASPYKASVQAMKASPLGAAFSQNSILLYWKGYFRKFPNFYYPDSQEDRALLRQFMVEAGISPGNGIRIAPDQVDAVLKAASEHGYGVGTVGGPDE